MNNKQWLQNYLSGLSDQRYEEALDILQELEDECYKEFYKELIRNDAIESMRELIQDAEQENS
jgi:predicted thioredoxin/glutaredoxin